MAAGAAAFLDEPLDSSRACLKNHSRNLHAPLCGIFHPNSVAAARYDALIRAKFPTNCDAHFVESLFQTRSNLSYKNNLFTRRKSTMKKFKTILMGLRTNLGATQVLVDDK